MGQARHGRRGVARPGKAWQEHGKDRGTARPGKARNGAWLGMARPGGAGHGAAWLGKEQGACRHPAERQNLNNKEGIEMKQRNYQVTLTGTTDLLMHQDNLNMSEHLKKWQKDPQNKKISVAGDDRSPAMRWIGNLYVDAGLVCIPSDNLMTMLREGGAKCPTGKRGATFKRQTQSGLVVDQAAWPLTIEGKAIEYATIKKLIDVPDFAEHLQYWKEASAQARVLTHSRAKLDVPYGPSLAERLDVFRPDREHGVNPLDPELGLVFPMDQSELELSKKDQEAPSLLEAKDLGLLPVWSGKGV
jgi:hypothetical protein